MHDKQAASSGVTLASPLRWLARGWRDLRDAPLPDAIPAGLCGRLKVGALGLRYVDELQGCPHP